MFQWRCVFAGGIFLTPPLLGYDQDENGELKMNEHEAKFEPIFYMYLKRQYLSGNCRGSWNLVVKQKRIMKYDFYGSVQILQNERHCGDVLARRWDSNYLDHKKRKNNQDRNQYRKREHHEAIISRDDFIAVQKLISNAKYGKQIIASRTSCNCAWKIKGIYHC